MEADANIRQTPSALAAEAKAEANAEAGLSWSSWFRCESSFSLFLVPHHPGVFALAEEIAAPAEAAAARRMLALFHVAEADDLARALSRLFTVDSPLRRQLQEGRCYGRYAAVPEPARRTAVAAALERWLAAASDSASALAEGMFAAHVAWPPSAAASDELAVPDPRTPAKDLRPSPLPAGF